MQEESRIREHYSENGYFFPIDAIPPAVAGDAAARYQRLVETPPQGLDHPWAIKTHLLADWVFELTTHPAVLDAVEAVIGPNILMQAADTFIKPARNDKIVNWHQDANYWGLLDCAERRDTGKRLHALFAGFSPAGKNAAH
jgi:hypothetical protein